MKYYRRIRIFTFISSPKDSYITFICFFLQRRQRIVCVCVWKKTSKKKKCTCHFLFCIFSYARKHVLAHASKALLICYLCEQIPAYTVAQALANNVLIYIWRQCVLRHQVRSKRKNYYSSSANNDELYYETRSHHWDLIRLYVYTNCDWWWWAPGSCLPNKFFCIYIENFLQIGWMTLLGIHEMRKKFKQHICRAMINNNNASLAVRINLPSSSSSSIWLKINKFTICDNLNGFQLLRTSFFLSLYPGLLLWTSVSKKLGIL